VKRLISLFITIITVFALSFGTQAYADNNNTISFEKAQRQLLENSRTLKKLKYNTYKAKRQYDDAVKMSGEIGIESIKRILAMFGRKLDPYDEMLLRKQRDYVPEMTKYYWNLSKNGEITTQNSLTLALRDMYLAFYAADSGIEIKQQKLKLAEKKYNQDKSKYDLGLVTKVELEESEHNLLSAQKNLNIAERDRGNAKRRLNSFIGVSVLTEYDILWFSEKINDSELMPVEHYIETAMNENLELSQIQQEIKLKELELSILDINEVGQIYRLARKDYGTLQNEIEKLKVKMEATKLQIENGIKNIYIDIKKEKSSIENTEKTLEMQKRNLARLQALYSSGMATQTVLEEMETGIKELENGLKISVYNYNTKIMKLKIAAGAGPAY